MNQYARHSFINIPEYATAYELSQVDTRDFVTKSYALIPSEVGVAPIVQMGIYTFILNSNLPVLLGETDVINSIANNGQWVRTPDVGIPIVQHFDTYGLVIDYANFPLFAPNLTFWGTARALDTTATLSLLTPGSTRTAQDIAIVTCIDYQNAGCLKNGIYAIDASNTTHVSITMDSAPGLNSLFNVLTFNPAALT